MHTAHGNAISEEEFDEFCCQDKYQDQWQQEHTGNEQGDHRDMYDYEDQRQLEYAGDQQGSTCNEQGCS